MSEQPTMTSPPQKKARGASRGGIVAVMVVAAVLVVGSAVAWWLLTRTEHPVAEGRQVEVRIPQGAGTEQIGRMLSSYGVIKNSLMFEIRAKMAKTALRSGTYLLATGMPDDLVLKRLAAGPQVTFYDVPIPEGFTAQQIATRFAKRAGVSEDEMTSLVMSGASQFVAKHPYLAGAAGGSLEGYLYPATYRVKKGTKPAAIVEMMLDKFDSATAGLDLSYAKSKNLTLNDVVTIGSILQRETKLSREYPLVASVIYNRLHDRMRLQLDSTVFYVAPEGTTKLTNADLSIESPYNTYRQAGLPPGPICSPGIEAIRGAAAPAQTAYLYYVLTGKDGSQTFTTTYKDFLAAVKKYHQVFGQ
jgi:peptidoglycan lytic transglycosylase G